MGQVLLKNYKLGCKVIAFLIVQVFILFNASLSFCNSEVLGDSGYVKCSTLSPKLSISSKYLIDGFRNETDSEDVSDLKSFSQDLTYEYYYSIDDLKAKIKDFEFFRKNIIESSVNKILWEVLNNPQHQHHKLIRNMLDVMVKHYSFVVNQYVNWPENTGKVTQRQFLEKRLDFARLRPMLVDYGYINNEDQINLQLKGITEEFKSQLEKEFIAAKKRDGKLPEDFSGNLPESFEKEFKKLLADIEFILRNAREHDAKTIEDELENETFVPLLNALAGIAGNEFINPKAVRLKTSLYAGRSVVDKEYSRKKEEATGKKALVRYWPMKGDPWQWGHVWLCLELFNSGADKVGLMIDDGDPTRKPDLSPLSFRDAMTQELMAAMAGYVDVVYYNREQQELLTADGDTVTATFLKENLDILPFMDLEYVAGYDHFADFLVLKKGEWQLDVPSKLMEVVIALLDQGIEAHLGAMFSYRDSDSEDDLTLVRKKERAYSIITEIGIRDYIAKKLSELVDGGNFNSQVKRTLNEIIFEFEKKTALMIEGDYFREGQREELDAEEKSLIKKWWTVYKEQRSKSKQIGWWLNKLYASIDDGQTEKKSIVETKILPNLVERIEANPGQSAEYYLRGSFPLLDSGKKLEAGDARHYVLDNFAQGQALPFRVFDQPMDASSTRLRKFGALQIVPYFSVQAAIAFGHFAYSGLTASEIVENDKGIGAEVLGEYLIDLGMLLNLAYNVSDKKIIEKEQMQQMQQKGKEVVLISHVFKRSDSDLIKEIVSAHLGNISNMADVNVIVELLKRRYADKKINSMLRLYFTDRKAFEEKVNEVKAILNSAYGTALHAVDGYLRNYLSEKDMFNFLVGLIEGRDKREKTHNLIRLVNGNLRAKLTKDRTKEIIKQQRKISEENLIPSSIVQLREQYNFLNASLGIDVDNASSNAEFEGGIRNLNLVSSAI